MMNSRKSVSSWKNRFEKIAYAATPAQITVSMPTHAIRCSFGNIDCSVTPEEYKSRVLIANNWKIAKIRYVTANQAGKPAVSTDGLVTITALGSSVPRAAPRTSSRTEGTRQPNMTASTMRLLSVEGARYLE